MRVLQLIDSLEAGGAERMAVTYANALLPHIEHSFLCTTRKEGLLKASLDSEVGYLFLNRRSTFDIKAFMRLRRFVRRHHIGIIHAHASSFFLASLLKVSFPKLNLVWHDHYGNSAFLEHRPSTVLRYCSYLFSKILVVNTALEVWNKTHLKCQDVAYLSNFAAYQSQKTATLLEGTSGTRILCLANLRPQKDHLNLIQAFAFVHRQHPEWSLHCVGQDFGDAYAVELKQNVIKLGLTSAVFFYGTRPDTQAIIEQCTIGVLSSKSEGLPLALLEYGLGQLAVVATNVGDCHRIISNTDEGLLVAPNDAQALAQALLSFIAQPQLRQHCGKGLYQKILTQFSETAIIQQLIKHYEQIV
ncbi:MAG: glycosyltransferase [Gelidibacter sp.]